MELEFQQSPWSFDHAPPTSFFKPSMSTSTNRSSPTNWIRGNLHQSGWQRLLHPVLCSQHFARHVASSNSTNHELCEQYVDVSRNRGGPPKWMVKIMENPMNKWMILGVPLFLEIPMYTLHIYYLNMLLWFDTKFINEYHYLNISKLVGGFNPFEKY